MIGFLAIGLVSCEPEFDSPVEEGFYSSGEADFSNYVAVGNSLTAGFADGALYISGQENSYPNIMAQQFALAGGGEFTQPLVNDNLGGLLNGGSQIAANRLVLSTTSGSPSPTPLDGVPTTDIGNVLTGPFNNMGVPGAKSFHLMSGSYGNPGALPNANPYFIRFASSPSATIIGDAVAQNPTFFSLWIGNNDILSYATNGGSGEDQTGNLDPSTYGPNDITDPNVFAQVYSSYVEQLTANGAKGVLVNIPDVTSIPFFTTVPQQAIPLDAATAAALNAQFGQYNNQILPLLVQFGVLSQAEANLRMINFVEGQNFPIIMDDDLTDVSGILQGPPANLPPATAMLLGQLRQANSDDLLTLTSRFVLGTQIIPGDITTTIGVGVPLGDQFVLTAVEQDRVKTATQSYNSTIRALADANDLAFVDARTALLNVANNGVAFDGGFITDTYVTGGAFSLDGVHPTARGYAFTANLIIDRINNKYNATIPTVNIGNYTTIILDDVPN